MFIIVIVFLQVKLDKNQTGKPSKVIHIRNIPNEVTEAEIIHLGIPFGRVTNVLVLKGKNQVSNLTAHFMGMYTRHISSKYELL